MAPLSFLYATLGGFMGVVSALVLAFFVARVSFLRWLGNAHRAAVCLICKQPMQHDDVPAPDEEGGSE